MLQMLEGYDRRELCRLMYLGFAGFIPEIQELKVPCPVCLTVWERDRTGRVRHYNEQWCCREGNPLHLVGGAAHNANVDAPEEVNRLLEHFLAKLSAEKIYEIWNKCLHLREQCDTIYTKYFAKLQREQEVHHGGTDQYAAENL